jgi:hypothetical protein
MRALSGIVCAALLLAPAMGHAEQLHAYFQPPEDGTPAALSISPCTGDEVAECVAHTLQCVNEGWPPVSFTVIEGPVEKIALAMIQGTDGKPMGTLTVGGKPVEVQFSSVYLDANEMDGGWVLTAGLTDAAVLFDNVSAANAQGTTITLGGETFALTPEEGDGTKLVEFVQACKAMQ